MLPCSKVKRNYNGLALCFYTHTHILLPSHVNFTMKLWYLSCLQKCRNCNLWGKNVGTLLSWLDTLVLCKNVTCIGANTLVVSLQYLLVRRQNSNKKNVSIANNTSEAWKTSYLHIHIYKLHIYMREKPAKHNAVRKKEGTLKHTLAAACAWMCLLLSSFWVSLIFLYLNS